MEVTLSVKREPENTGKRSTKQRAPMLKGTTLEGAAATRERPSAADVPFLLMAIQRRGIVDAARDALDKLRTAMKNPDMAGNATLNGFLREAGALVAGRKAR